MSKSSPCELNVLIKLVCYIENCVFKNRKILEISPGVYVIYLFNYTTWQALAFLNLFNINLGKWNLEH